MCARVGDVPLPRGIGRPHAVGVHPTLGGGVGLGELLLRSAVDGDDDRAPGKLLHLDLAVARCGRRHVEPHASGGGAEQCLHFSARPRRGAVQIVRRRGRPRRGLLPLVAFEDTGGA